MMIQLIKQDVMTSMILPKMKQGVYFIDVLMVEAYKDKWRIKTKEENYHILGVNEEYLNLKDDLFYYVLIQNKKAILFIYDNDHYQFDCYKMEKTSLIVGRNENCDIVYQKDYISNEHMKIIYNGMFEVYDLNSSNGIYSLGKRITYMKGYEITIDLFLVRIILIDDVLFISRNHELKVKGLKLLQNENKIPYVKKESFYRKFRIYQPVHPFTIHLEAIHLQEQNKANSIWLTIVPAMLMIFASSSSLFFMKLSKESMYMMIVMMISMIVSCAIMPVIVNKLELKNEKKKRSNLIHKYLKYLSDLQKTIDEQLHIQRHHNLNHFHTMKQLEQIIIKQEPLLFAKRIFHDDFMVVALGLGNPKAKCSITSNEKGFEAYEHELSEKLQSFKNQTLLLKQVFVTCDLKQYQVVSIYGKEYQKMMEYLLMQLCIYHGSDELKIIYCTNHQNHMYYRFIPHLYHDSMRFYVDSKDEMITMIPFIENYKEGAIVMFVDDYQEYQSILDIKRLTMNKNLVIILGCFHEYHIASESDVMIEVSDQAKIYNKQGICESFEFEKQEVSLPTMIKNLMICQNQFHKHYIKDQLSFFEMYQIQCIEHYNILHRWYYQHPLHSMKVAIGVNEQETIYLDLHEKKHGPHGLIGGMTGSGKSEWIISFLLSICMNYHPDDVNFCIIDYKGGGLADVFIEHYEYVPHLVGVITNLDKELIDRSLKSLQGELHRRQLRLKQAREQLNDASIDIYKYQQYYYQNKLKQPLSHLLLVVDEFAQLKQDQKDFMDQLISMARIGRSLGIHLLLSTQKPYGVVDEQIWSNTNFKVCLKVADESDSNDLLRSPLGAYLQNAGRFYLKIGNDTNLILAQSPYANGKTSNKAENMIFYDAMMNPKVIMNQKPTSDKSECQMVIQHLIQLKKQLNYQNQFIYLEPLDETKQLIHYQSCYQQDDKNKILIGEIDDPLNQRKMGLYYDVCQHLLIYGSKGSGKKDVIETICCALSHCDIHVIDLLNELKDLKEANVINTYLCMQDQDLIEVLLRKLKKQIFKKHTILIIHEYRLFHQYFYEYEELFIQLLMMNQMNHLSLIITSSQTNINYQISGMIDHKLSLYFEDISEYHMIYSHFNEVAIKKIKRRGYIKLEQYHQFQIAKVDVRMYQQNKKRKSFVSDLNLKDIEKIMKLNHKNKLIVGYDLEHESLSVNLEKEKVIVCSKYLMNYEIFIDYMNQYMEKFEYPKDCLEVVHVSLIHTYDEAKTYLYLGEGYQEQYYFPYIKQEQKQYKEIGYFIRNQKVTVMKLVGEIKCDL